MKQLLLSLLLSTSIGTVYSGPNKLQVAAQQTRRTTSDLFLAGKGAEAVAYLQTEITPEKGPDGSKFALAEALIDVASSLYNQRRLDIAGQVVIQALAVGIPITSSSGTAAAGRKAALLSSLGMLCENVLMDFKQAERLYRAAEALNPIDPHLRARRDAVAEKQKNPRG